MTGEELRKIIEGRLNKVVCDEEWVKACGSINYKSVYPKGTGLTTLGVLFDQLDGSQIEFLEVEYRTNPEQ